MGLSNIFQTSFSTNGTSWNSPVQIIPSFSPQLSQMSVAANPNGFLASFVDVNGTSTGYVSFSSDNGATWGSEVQVATMMESGTTLALGANSSGFMAAWVDSTMQQIFTSFSSDNGENWSSPVQIPMTQGTADTYITIDANENVFIATWADNAGKGMASCSSDNGATWSTPVFIPFSFLGSTSPSNAVGVSVQSSTAMFTYRENDGADPFSSFADISISTNGAPSPPPPSSSFYKQINPNKPGRQFFE